MRIVGGKWSGRPLVSVGKGDEKNRLRPTSDRVRESLFNVLEHGDYPAFEGARVLDLFAGTGALGLEALSRGAAQVTFVEKGRTGQGIIRGNIKQLQCDSSCQLRLIDATKLAANRFVAKVDYISNTYRPGGGATYRLSSGFHDHRHTQIWRHPYPSWIPRQDV